MENKEFYSSQIYLSDRYKNFISGCYTIADPSCLQKSSILRLLYALEWFSIPESYILHKVKFNPYLSFEDSKKINKLILFNRIEYILSFLLFSKIVHRTMKIKFPIIRLFSSICLGTTCTFLKNIMLMKKLNLKILKEQNLSKYLQLEVDKEKLKKDLMGMGITKMQAL